MPTVAPEQWQGASSQLPSFYSPPTNTSQATDDVEQPDFSLTASASASQVESNNGAPKIVSLPPSTPLARVPPPPSLLSPAFTPPSTPGTLTPLVSEPRGVPVDSSIPTGGCGTKQPKLLQTLPEVQCVVRARIPTTTGTEMFLHLYTNSMDNKEHLAIVFGDTIRSKSLDAPHEGETEMDRLVRGAYTGRLYPGRTTSGMVGGSEGGHEETPTPPLVRIHSECYTGETVWSARCDCGEQLDEAARLMSLPGNKAGGIIIYLRQEGRGIGLGEKLKAYNLQDLGNDTVEANLLLRHPADARSYGLATAMLLDLGQKDIRLLTNNPDKIRAVEGPNREVVVKERVKMEPLSWKGSGGVKGPELDGYLKTKHVMASGAESSSSSGARSLRHLLPADPALRDGEPEAAVTIHSTTRVPPKSVHVKAACDLCRKKKVKCSGERPKCVSCTRNGTACHYASAPAETHGQALKRKFGELQEEKSIAEELCQMLCSLPEQEAIEVLLRLRVDGDVAATLHHVKDGRLLLQLTAPPQKRHRRDSSGRDENVSSTGTTPTPAVEVARENAPGPPAGESRAGEIANNSIRDQG
ncbi:hypothetical protein OQA88_11774 [Cercophora sp. LCS_1]